MESNAIDLDLPVAWITGSGAARVGQSVAAHFADHGYRIVLHANKSRAEAHTFAAHLQNSGTRTMVVEGAIENPRFGIESVEKIVETFGRIDVLINSAAIWDWKPFEETTAADVQRQFEVNTLGTFLCSQAAGLQMVKQPTGGAIVLIGDWAVHRPYRDFSSYFVGKGAIETMTRSLAIELATRNSRIRVNAILPGPVMLDESISEKKALTILNQSLLKRHGEPHHVSEAAYFLATHEFITGVCLNVDGGRSIYSENSVADIAHPTFGK